MEQVINALASALGNGVRTGEHPTVLADVGGAAALINEVGDGQLSTNRTGPRPPSGVWGDELVGPS